jgi:hypothetical protein
VVSLEEAAAAQQALNIEAENGDPTDVIKKPGVRFCQPPEDHSITEGIKEKPLKELLAERAGESLMSRCSVSLTTLHLSEKVGVIFNIKQFPWKTMLNLLASAGVVCVNWPEDVLMPGEAREGIAKGKGFSDLTLHEQALLKKALTHDTHPLRFVGTDKKEGNSFLILSNHLLTCSCNLLAMLTVTRRGYSRDSIGFI